MPLILTNEEIAELFTLDECFRCLEPALRDLGNGLAVSMPRQDLLVPGPAPDTYHGLKTSCASLPRAGVTTMRLTSDLLSWPMIDGRRRRKKIPRAMGDRYVGLVLVFSTASGELLAIFPDGLVQAIRVGVTNALSAKYLARKESSVMALYGSGWQAGPALTAMCKVLPIREARVYSPTKAHRDAFVRRMANEVDATLIPLDSPSEAAYGADVVCLATNALDPFFPAAWIRDGMHITTVRPSEMTLDALLRCDLIAVSTREAAGLFTLPGREHEIPEFGLGDYGRAELRDTAADWRDKPEIGEIIAGKSAGRTHEAQVTCMLNHLGVGVPFTAAAAAIYELAKARGIGRELPGEWFCQTEHS